MDRFNIDTTEKRIDELEETKGQNSTKERVRYRKDTFRKSNI